MLICFELEKSAVAKQFMKDTKERLQRPTNFISNPFRDQKFYSLNDTHYAINMVPIWPHFYMYGWFGAALAGLLSWPLWVVAIGIIIGCTGIAYSSPFYFLMLKAGLRKAGYNGKVKRLTEEALLRRVLWGK